ncbi:MAG TPA: type IV pilus biogenesis/stability protein PilW [Burkholderiales bacterium]|nr:type IV pilus biogenesis/stability protein PilW [Burkholderiales bacterium]
MRRAAWCILLLAAGCAGQPEVSGPVANTGTIVGDPTSPRNRARVHADLAVLYYSRGSMNIALEEARTAVAADATYASAHGVLGLVYMELRENALAEQAFERALAYAPEDPDINHNFGWFLCQIGRAGDSRRYFRRALDNPLYATPGRTYAAAGTCALRAGDLKEAELNLERALRLEPNLPIAMLQLAQLRYRQSRYHDARAALTRHAAVAAPSAESLWLGVRIERRLGQRASELSYANQLRRRFPDSPEYQALQSGKYD